MPKGPEVFDQDSAAITYSHDDEKFYNVKAFDSPTSLSISLVEEAKEGNVTFERLSQEHQKKFLKSRDKEATTLIEAGAIELMSMEELRAFERAHPECVLDSLWTEKWKATDETTLVPKSRWCVVGWRACPRCPGRALAALCELTAVSKASCHMSPRSRQATGMAGHRARTHSSSGTGQT